MLTHTWQLAKSQVSFRDVPTNVPREGDKSKLPRREALFAQNDMMNRVFIAFFRDFHPTIDSCSALVIPHQ